VGQSKGFFKEANLDVKMIYMSTSIAAKGLMSGDVDYSTAMGGTLRGNAHAKEDSWVKTIVFFKK